MSYALTEARREENVDRFGIGGVASQKWRAGLEGNDLAAVYQVAGNLLGELGYSRSASTETTDAVAPPGHGHRIGVNLRRRRRG